jgi:hypothetical protein
MSTATIDLVQRRLDEMTISRATLLTLVLISALGVACSEAGDQASNGVGDKGSNNSSAALNDSLENLKTNFNTAAAKIDSAVVALNLAESEGNGKLKKITDPVTIAVEALAKDDTAKIARGIASPSAADARAELRELQQAEESAKTHLGTVEKILVGKQHDVFTDDEREKVASGLKNAKEAISTGLNHREQLEKSIAAFLKADDERKNKGADADSSSRDLIVLVAEVLGSVLLFALVVFGIVTLNRRHWVKFDEHVGQVMLAHLGSLKNQQTDLGSKLSTLASAQGELGTRLSDIQTEVRSLGKLVRDAALDGGRRGSSTPMSSQTDQTPPKDEPAFPISAGDYLERMRRFSSVVKPDFQNGILVDDPEGRGELALIRDSRVPDDIRPLFVIPRSTQFQTKQDFHTYYEKYYDCQRPTAGEVWIIDPAVVSTVPGGWQLREKGVLEVR